MPHLSKLATQYQDRVTFVSVSDEPKETVEKFLTQPSTSVPGKTWSQAMAFTVATDPDSSVKNAIFTASGQSGIPSSFIINEGVVEWIGHPLYMDEPLAAVVDGRWDRNAFRDKYAKQQAEKRAMVEIRRSVMEASKAENWDEAIAIYDRAIEKFPDSNDLRYAQWNLLLTKAHRDDKAYALGRDLVERVWDNQQMLNQIAWIVADDKSVQTRDLDFALKAAVRANELTEGKDAAILDTVARVHYEKGNLKKALQWQRKAVKNAGDDGLADQLREALKKYEKESKGTDL